MDGVAESLIGIDERSELFRRFLDTVGPHHVDTEINDRVTIYCCHGAGIEVSCCRKTRRVTVVVTYRAGATPQYAELRGPLPLGLSFGATIEQAKSSLGDSAEADGEGLRLSGPDYTLSTKFDRKGRLCRVALFT